MLENSQKQSELNSNAKPKNPVPIELEEVEVATSTTPKASSESGIAERNPTFASDENPSIAKLFKDYFWYSPDTMKEKALNVAWHKKHNLPIQSVSWISYILVKFNFCVFLLLIIIPVVLSVIALVYFPMILESGSDTNFRDYKSQISKDTDRFELAKKTLTIGTKDLGSFVIIYVSKPEGDNIFTAERMAFIKEYESKCRGTQNCELAVGTNNCALPATIINYMYPNATNPAVYDGSGTVLANITATLEHIAQPAQIEQQMNFMDKSFSANNLRSSAVRSVFLFEKHSNGSALQADIDAFEKWTVDNYYNYAFKSDSDRVEVLFFSNGIIDEMFNNLIISDTYFAIGSFFVVFFYLAWHTESVVLAIMGMFHITIAFPLCYFIFRVIIDIRVMGTLNFLALFIILGIGADDVFLYTDAWKQSGGMEKNITKNLYTRTTYAYNRSVFSMFITTITTMMAFFLAVLSPIPSINQFGIFTTMIVLSNYIMIVSYYPAALLTWHRLYLPLKKKILGLCFKNKSGNSRILPHIPYILTFDLSGSAAVDPPQQTNVMWNKIKSTVQLVFHIISLGYLNIKKFKIDYASNDEQPKNYSVLEIFFRFIWAPLVYKSRWIVIVIFTFVFCSLSIISLRIDVSKDPAKWLDDDHRFMRWVDYMATKLNVMEISGLNVFVVFGIGPLDRSMRDKNDINDLGSISYEPSFSVVKPSAQQAFYDYCTTVHLRGQEQKSSTAWSYSCPFSGPHGFKTFLTINSEPFPTTEERFPILFKLYSQTPSFLYYHASEVGYTIANGNLTINWMYVKVNTDMTYNDGLPELRRMYDWFHSDLESELSNSPEVLTKAFATCPIFTWLQTSETLIKSSLQGIVISMLAVAVMVFFATSDILITIISMLSICFVVLVTLSWIVLTGWNLGMIESICIIIVVGLAVDYIVHLGHSYNMSKHETRYMKMREALTHMGTSILSAAITTCASSVILFFTEVVFFRRFGAFIFLIAFSSAASAFFPFTALLMAMGPTGDGWSYKRLLKYPIRKYRESKALQYNFNNLEKTFKEAKSKYFAVKAKIIGIENTHKDKDATNVQYSV